MKPSEEKSEDKRKESGEKDKNPSSQIPKGKTLLIILNLFYIYSCGESSARKEDKFHWKHRQWWNHGDQRKEVKFNWRRNW